MTNAQRKARTAKITARSAFALGVVVSMAANVYAADHTPIGIAIALWVPIAFLVSMALLENVPAKGMAGKVRFVGIVFLALIAGWASYWHMVDVAVAGGADSLVAHTLPLTVDVMLAFAGSALKTKIPATPARRRATIRKNNVTSIRKTG
jgi:apolipoprotein N-acyltransferase